MRRRWLNLLRVLISVGALAFLFWKVGLSETVAVLRQGNLGYLAFAWLLLLVSLLVRAVRWRVLLEGLGMHIPYGRLTRLYFVGQFFSGFLPSQFGGDVVRAIELTQDAPSAAAIGTVLVDRMTGLMTLFVMSLAVLPTQVAVMKPGLIGVLIGVAGGGLVAGLMVLDGHLLRWATAKLPRSLSLAGEGTLAHVYAAVTGCGWPAILKALGISVGFNLLNVFINWLCGRAVGIQLGLGYFFVTTPLLAVGGLIPSIGGWGVREMISTAAFTSAGVDANIAAALGVSLGAVTLLASLLGGILYGIEGALGLHRDQRVSRHRAASSSRAPHIFESEE